MPWSSSTKGVHLIHSQIYSSLSLDYSIMNNLQQQHQTAAATCKMMHVQFKGISLVEAITLAAVHLGY